MKYFDNIDEFCDKNAPPMDNRKIPKISRRIEMLVLRRRTNQDEILDMVPKPKRSLPPQSLPGWEHLPLHFNLPMHRTPYGEMIFSRNKLGKSLYSREPSRFSSENPKEENTIMPYNSLHDPSLYHYYRSPVVLKTLLERGFITKDLEVPCSLKSFNTYRRHLYKSFLYKVHDLRDTIVTTLSNKGDNNSSIYLIIF